MSIRNQNWYNLQSTRRYPLDENSTGLDDANVFIKDDILVDCHIRFPNTYGKYVYVQGITVSPGLVTVVFGVSNVLGSKSGEPLAAVTLPKPVSTSVNYPVTALKPGVSGWVVFGGGIENNFSGRYTTVQQTLVSARCARAYKPLPVPTIGKLGLADTLQGVVKILGELPVRVRYAADAGRVVAMVNGEKIVQKDTVPALIVELDTTQITENYNPLQLFLGPCAQRPESGTCTKTPIETINGIAPDCAGNIEIIFENFANPQAFESCGGVDIVTDQNLPAVCAATKKRRPEAYQDNCCVPEFEVPSEADLANIPEDKRKPGLIAVTVDTNERWSLDADLVTWSITNSSEYCTWPDPADAIPDVIIDELIEIPTYPAVAIPACVDFTGCAGADLFTAQSGSFTTASVMAPAGCPSCDSAELDANTLNTASSAELINQAVYASEKLSSLNITTFNNSATDWALNKVISAEIRIGTAGLERNGGIVLNYQELLSETQRLQVTFVAVMLDATRGQVRVLRYTNSSVTVEATSTMPIKTGTWYKLSVTPVQNGDSVSINIYVEEMTPTDPATTSMVVQIDAASYGPLLGAAGLIANRSVTYFNRFTIVE